MKDLDEIIMNLDLDPGNYILEDKTDDLKMKSMGQFEMEPSELKSKLREINPIFTSTTTKFIVEYLDYKFKIASKVSKKNFLKDESVTWEVFLSEPGLIAVVEKILGIDLKY